MTRRRKRHGGMFSKIARTGDPSVYADGQKASDELGKMVGRDANQSPTGEVGPGVTVNVQLIKPPRSVGSKVYPRMDPEAARRPHKSGKPPRKGVVQP